MDPMVVITKMFEIDHNARHSALHDAEELANTVYMRLIGDDPKPCLCGNGRIPTGAYRAAVDAYAQAIRDLSASA